MVPEEEAQKLNKDYRPNRATRRRKPQKPRFTIIDYINVPSNILTKPSHKYKELRKKHAEQNRKRAIARARKERKENSTKVS